jgi:hypothetical protein
MITNESVEATVRRMRWEKRTYPFRIVGYLFAFWYYKWRTKFTKALQKKVTYSLNAHKYFCLLPKKWRNKSERFEFV